MTEGDVRKDEILGPQQCIYSDGEREEVHYKKKKNNYCMCCEAHFVSFLQMQGFSKSIQKCWGIV